MAQWISVDSRRVSRWSVLAPRFLLGACASFRMNRTFRGTALFRGMTMVGAFALEQ